MKKKNQTTLHTQAHTPTLYMRLHRTHLMPGEAHRCRPAWERAEGEGVPQAAGAGRSTEEPGGDRTASLAPLGGGSLDQEWSRGGWEASRRWRSREVTPRPDQSRPKPSCDSRWAGCCVVLDKFPGLSAPSFPLVSSSTHSVSKPPICARHCPGHGAA